MSSKMMPFIHASMRVRGGIHAHNGLTECSWLSTLPERPFYVIAADKELLVTVQPHYKTSVMELLVAVLQLELHNEETLSVLCLALLQYPLTCHIPLPV